MSGANEKNFYKEYEVFSKKSNKLPLQHQFSLLAPNKEMALMMAQENFMRREDAIDIWVVAREDIRALTGEEKQVLTKRLDNKDYRNTKGYGYLRKLWREKEEKLKMLDEKEIMSWSEGRKG
ncbi:1,2-phenylacetyl-CoA epoxidase subunit PaaB [Pseudogracilibacillus auburnensis]|uniref:Ring-1,2-phenylacetyl-CoA epoxidase subunit PaaB n=1 Tax=Pseudogracilibacillus auburnensis TaxID=1494959 RepID=A0A2V3VVA2_9BACI|nr:ring-1,2-phenylacetyl-CoA epoxidase subunit PaaB [Pseudogracilibacillus auburnensis]